MMIQRDSLTENMILQGRYEVRKAIHTTQVERDYEVYDREEKKEYRVKEFYPSNYCSRGADGQTVIVRGARNQSVFEQSKEWFAQAYRLPPVRKQRGSRKQCACFRKIIRFMLF